jgi:hypothetical protein
MDKRVDKDSIVINGVNVTPLPVQLSTQTYSFLLGAFVVGYMFGGLTHLIHLWAFLLILLVIVLSLPFVPVINTYFNSYIVLK